MAKSPKHITCEHLADLRSDGEKEHVILDIRDVLEFESGHIAGSVNVPRKELQTNVERIIPEKAAKVVVVVGPTQTEEIDAVHATLAGLGFKDVEFLAGGFDRWCEIAPLEIEPDLTEQTPEEAGAVERHGHLEEDPHEQGDEPIL
jgi:rhodanese-related sulfurtransferase